jgi:CheY-like chemotaxis protein
MDPETCARIFEPFFTTKGRGQGSGLGLATVYGIVQQHRGTIEVQSEIGRGTSFSIFLPECVDSTAGRAVDGRASSRPGGSESVVVAEDNDLVRNLACSILRRQGYHVIEAGGAEECIARVGAHDGEIHLLLADVVMPEMNGRDLYQRLLALRPALRVLYMSGYTDEVIAQHGVLEEGVQFLQKPFPVQALLDKVRGILDG